MFLEGDNPHEAEATTVSAPELSENRTHTPGPTEFAARAEDIFSGVNYQRRRGASERDAYKTVASEYVASEEAPDLAKFSDVMLSLPDYQQLQKQGDKLLPYLRQNHSPESKKYYDAIVGSLIDYNHKLRDLIYDNPGSFSRQQLQEWLEKSATGDSSFVEPLLNGIGAEVAVAREAKKVDGVASVRLSSADEDLRGVDLVVSLENGQEKHLDVKHGEEALVQGLDKKKSGHEIFGVFPEDLNGFSFRKESRGRVKQDLSRVLGIDKPKIIN